MMSMRNSRGKKWLKLFILAIISFHVSFGKLPVQAQSSSRLPRKLSSLRNGQDAEGSRLQVGHPAPGVSDIWARIERQALGKLEVFWHPSLGTPEALYGSLAPAARYGVEPEAIARSFFIEQSDLFKFSKDLEDLALDRRVDTPGGVHLYYRQTVGGLPVFGSEVALHINAAGVICGVTNNYEPELVLQDTTPKVTADQVHTQFLAELGTSDSRVRPVFQRRELGVQVANGQAILAWHLITSSHEPLGTWESFYDAITGTRLAPIVDRNCYADGTGKIFLPNAGASTDDNGLSDQNNSAGAVPPSAYTTASLLGLDGSGFINGPFVNTKPTANRVNRANNDFTDQDRSLRGFEEVEAYWAIDTAQRYVQSFGYLNAANYSIGVNVHAFPDDNSFYAGFGNGQGQISFGDGGVDDAEDAEIVWHEYGHALLDNQKTNINQNFDGMGEGYADYLAATNAARQPSTDHAQYDPAVGEWDATSYNPGNPPFLRRVDTNAHYPEDRSGDPHVTGMIWSGALWDIKNAIGQATADHIFLEGNFLLPSSPLLPQAAQSYLQADMNLFGGSHQAAMNAVFTARGLLGGSTPLIDVDSPTGGEVWQIGTTQTITWNSNAVSSDVRIRLSRNGGSTYTAIFNSVANSGSIPWVVAGPAGTQCRIQVVSLNDTSIRDSSDSDFTIGSTPGPTIPLNTPNGGENWQVGTSQTITWSSTNVSGNVKIELSRNGVGGPFETLFASVANDGSEVWPVNGSPSSNCFVKISSLSAPSVSDPSNTNFTISDPPTGPSIRALTPNGGEAWPTGTSQTIRWTSDGSSGNVKIRLSRNGGMTYSSLFNSVPNTGSITWMVTGPMSNNCKIQVLSVTNQNIRDTSDGNFSITP